MKDQSIWKGKTALFCYLALAGGIFLGSLIGSIILLAMGQIGYQKLTFPFALISIPVTEGVILGITVIFANHEGANLKKLGLKKPSLKVILIISFAAVLLLLLAGTVSVIEEVVLGPDLNAEDLLNAVLPRNLFQLIILIGLSIALVGPIEELAFRGFIQRGFENSFGKTGGLLITSALFGLLHGLNSLRAIIPVFVSSLVLGYVWQKTNGNTIASAWMHGLYDAITLTVAYFASI